MAKGDELQFARTLHPGLPWHVRGPFNRKTSRVKEGKEAKAVDSGRLLEFLCFGG